MQGPSSPPPRRLRRHWCHLQATFLNRIGNPLFCYNVAAMKPYVLKRGPDSPAEPKFSLNYEAELNPGQLAAVKAVDGPILVIAGAGSGKTRTLVYRVARLIESGTDPSRIMLLTFTNKAAREMLRRVESLLSVDTRRLMGGTFHSVGSRLMRRFGSRVGLSPNFTILDEEYSREVFYAASSDLKIQTLEKRFTTGDVLSELYSFAINTGRRSPESLA